MGFLVGRSYTVALLSALTTVRSDFRTLGTSNARCVLCYTVHHFDLSHIWRLHATARLITPCP